jgi:hypothetical protein
LCLFFSYWLFWFANTCQSSRLALSDLFTYVSPPFLSNTPQPLASVGDKNSARPTTQNGDLDNRLTGTTSPNAQPPPIQPKSSCKRGKIMTNRLEKRTRRVRKCDGPTKKARETSVSFRRVGCRRTGDGGSQRTTYSVGGL